MTFEDNVAVVIQTKNEEKNIEDCIKSAKLLTENIYLIDMKSEDNTLKIAKKFHVKIFQYKPTNYVEPARKFAINKTNANWVFILDADERITFNLAKEIKEKIKFSDYGLFKVPRKNIFGKIKWLKHGGWWPDYQIRLINKNKFINWPKQIHSTPVIKGKVGFLKNPLIHYFHGDLEQMVKKTIIFENIEANLLYQANKKVNLLTFFRKFFGEIWRRLIKKMGFLDGTIGIIESIYQAFSKTITYLFLYEKYQSKK